MGGAPAASDLCNDATSGPADFLVAADNDDDAAAAADYYVDVTSTWALYSWGSLRQVLASLCPLSN